MSVRNLGILPFLSRRFSILVFYLGQDIANDFASVLIDSDLGKLRMTRHVIEPVAQVVVLGQIVEIAVLHLEQICYLCRSDSHHRNY